MKNSAEAYPQLEQLPRHVAIIMDGNNRWAKARKLPGVAGHRAGVESVRAVIEVALRQGIEALTLFAFSSENWKRPEDEVTHLMELFQWVLKKEIRRLNKYEVRLKIIGDRSAFSRQLQQLMARAEARTAANKRMTLVVAANYGGRWDLLQATRKLAQTVAQGQLQAEDLSEEHIQAELSLAELPDPDLCIRTSGEQRISNFLLWQLAYAELVFAKEFWPDFRQDAFFATLQEFSQRQRRFGGREEQPAEE
ncbi:undecaprenyl diphosphate synthase [Marinospirillum celere]|uniref:Ditrans,polycis-undecaprenyl-diphosphate synthase ((2E,6E)-farnesyl-diphosphate specific) n=1 Tax=Marinospirillum celere TaxID=1122252 RepID=A0A1I1IPU3_9GAMM|nr:polyprenyl diphosphate synthase [Marinospirillum celere]SFC38244.1 undecaprenyl diphosphate synthase [Marinospirillum celere]